MSAIETLKTILEKPFSVPPIERMRIERAITQIKQLQAEKKELIERIELAVDDLPESPGKAKSFLVPALKGK